MIEGRCRAPSRRPIVDLDVELHAPDPREIVLARIEEQCLETQLRRRIDGRRIARAEPLGDQSSGVVLLLDGVLAERRRR